MLKVQTYSKLCPDDGFRFLSQKVIVKVSITKIISHGEKQKLLF